MVWWLMEWSGSHGVGDRKMKLARVLTELIGIVLLIGVIGCSSATPVEVTATPRAQATIEVRATESVASQATATLTPKSTDVPIVVTPATPISIRAQTPQPTSTPVIGTSEQEEPSWEYIGFTHAPVDFTQTLVEEPSCGGAMLMPFFNYLNTNHAEGPRKWYIKACPGDIVKVYLPTKALLRERGIRVSGDHTTYNGDDVITDVKTYFEASTDITPFFMHLTLLADIKNRVEQSESGYEVFEAGTHIGYIYSPIQSKWSGSLDFGVEDKSVDTGLTQDDDHWWNIRANPLDYFTKEVRQSIVAAYQHEYQRLIDDGTYPFADLEDSRANFNDHGKIWGIWFKDEFPNAFSSDAGHSGTAWSVINVVRTEDLTQETYWQTLEQFPDLSGLFVEQARKEAVGKSLYGGGPIGESRFFILFGDDTSGVARIDKSRDWEGSRTIYLKYEVIRHSENASDDMLKIEGFLGRGDAEGSFSDEAVQFRRSPCGEAASEGDRGSC